MQAVQALPASFRSSLRPVSTSNGAGSRAAGSRGPWSSAELATRPVRKGPPKPKGNAPDSRKTRTSNLRIPESGKGLSSAPSAIPVRGPMDVVVEKGCSTTPPQPHQRFPGPSPG